MAEDRTLPYGGPLPATWLAAIQEFIGSAPVNFRLSLANTTTVQVVASANSGQVGLGIDGLFRYISATVTAAVTGAAGLYDIYATTGPNNFVATGGTPPETDSTDYRFQLQVLPHGTTPTTSSSLTNFRLIGELDWDGTKVTGIRRFIGSTYSRDAITPTAPTKDVVPVRTVGAASQSAPLATWETSAGITVASISPTGGMTLADALSGTTATFTGSMSSGSAAITGNASVGGTLTAQALAVTAGAAFTQIPTAPTKTPASDASTALATTAFVWSAINSAPAGGVTSAQAAALAGTSGAPSGTNKYVTDSDPRNANARTPTAHAATHQPGGTDAMAVDAAAATGSLRTLGTGAQQAAAGNDSRLSDARTPVAHAASHAAGGSDPVTPAAISAMARLIERPLAGGTTTAVDGDLIVAAGSTTVNLTTATAGRVAAIQADTGVSGTNQVTVSVASGVIVGNGLGATATSFKIGTPNATVVLVADGNNWRIVAGQQDSGWVPITPQSGATSAYGGAYVPASRLEGDRVRLKGALVNSSAATLNPGVRLGTITAAHSPTVNVNLPGVLGTAAGGTATSVLSVTSGGLISTLASVPVGQAVYLDGVAYTLS